MLWSYDKQDQHKTILETQATNKSEMPHDSVQAREAKKKKRQMKLPTNLK